MTFVMRVLELLLLPLGTRPRCPTNADRIRAWLAFPVAVLVVVIIMVVNLLHLAGMYVLPVPMGWVVGACCAVLMLCLCMIWRPVGLKYHWQLVTEKQRQAFAKAHGVSTQCAGCGGDTTCAQQLCFVGGSGRAWRRCLPLGLCDGCRVVPHNREDQRCNIALVTIVTTHAMYEQQPTPAAADTIATRTAEAPPQAPAQAPAQEQAPFAPTVAHVLLPQAPADSDMQFAEFCRKHNSSNCDTATSSGRRPSRRNHRDQE